MHIKVNCFVHIAGFKGKESRKIIYFHKKIWNADKKQKKNPFNKEKRGKELRKTEENYRKITKKGEKPKSWHAGCF